jgi:ParB family chromosome partitioning protein
MSRKHNFDVSAATALARLDGVAAAPAVPEFVPAAAPGSSPESAGQLRLVAPHLLDDNPLNARQIYLDGALRRLADDLKLRGQLTPVRAIERSGRLVLVDGHRRVKAARLAGLAHVRVEVVAPPREETGLYFDSLAANLHREPPTPLDDSLIWRELLDRGVFATQEELAEALRTHTGRAITQEQISRTLQLQRLPETVRDACVAASLINLRYLYALLGYFTVRGEADCMRLVLETVEHGLSARDVENRVRTATGPARPKPHAMRYKVGFGEGRGELREFDQDGRVELHLKGLSASARSVLVEQLRALLASGAQRAESGAPALARKGRSASAPHR